MTYQTFAQRVRQAAGRTSLSSYQPDPDEYDQAIYIYANDRRLATLRKLANLNRPDFSQRYGIPLRTLENWEATGESARRAPSYVLDLLAYAVITAQK